MWFIGVSYAISKWCTPSWKIVSWSLPCNRLVIVIRKTNLFLICHLCACSMQSPFIPEVTSSNSLKTRMVFVRTWYIVVFTVNASQSNCATWKIWDLLIIQYNGKTKATRIENKNHTSHPFTCSPSELKLSTPRNIEILVCLNCWWWNLKVQWIVFYFPVIILKNPRAPKLQTVEVTEESS